MTPEVSITRKALIAVLLAVALFAAVVIQLTVVNRLPLPGAAPDLVLLLVIAIAVATGPATGAVTGFVGGLALDVAPPAAHYAGEYALVFCLAGYGAARLIRAVTDRTGERDPVAAFTVMAVGAAAGEAGKAALGLLLSAPDVTGAAISRLLPGAILYDLLLSPLALWLVARVTRGAVTAAPERAPAPGFGRAQRLAPVFRQASAGAAPVLFAPRGRFAGTGANHRNQSSARVVPKLRFAGTGANHANPSPARRVPKLRLSAAHSGTTSRTSAAGTPSSPLPLAGGRARRLNFAGSPPPRTTRSTTRSPGKNWLRSPVSSVIPTARRAVRVPSRGWLRTAGAGGLRGVGGSRGGLANGRAPARPRGFAGARAGSARATGFPIAGGPARSAAEALAARSAPSGLSALAGGGTPLAHRRSPSRGWLGASRSAAPTFPRQRRSPRSGWLGSASRPRTVIGRTVTGSTGRRTGARGGGPKFRRSAFRGRNTIRGNWYTASPPGAWLRRSRHPWRKHWYLPGGRPPVPPGARAMAKGATVSRTRQPRLFGLLGGRR